MKHTKSILFYFLGLFILLFTYCTSEEEPEKGIFPATPVNFEAINSIYDDYNMDIPLDLSNTFPMVFSTNRKFAGSNFDFIDYIVQYYYLPDSKEFHFEVVQDYYWFFDSALVKVNTKYNEFGPLIVNVDSYNILFFYSSDTSGNLDIYYSECGSDNSWLSPSKLNSVNSNYNDAYQSFNKEGTKMYFCSDSIGNYDIYFVRIPASMSLINWIQTSEKLAWESLTLINSAANDKCPYVNGDLMVFASDREGGYGGFDLYYSVFKDKAWSAPVNFGPEINSEYDEYRPVTAYVYNYKNDLMLFSSNRPGGLGGFDLHYVGIPKMIE